MLSNCRNAKKYLDTRCVVKMKLKGGAQFHCIARLHHSTIILLDLVTCIFCLFYVTLCQCFDIEKLTKVKKGERSEKIFETRDREDLW